mgnify:CR=1 FL=1|tara:strand:+ start:3624 stop:4226 length:603 start_codon:yes stop_codon:yes gene_type:complete
MSNVKSYTDEQLINRMKSLPSFKGVPNGKHIIAVRSSEDEPDKYDDKLYLFDGDKCISVMSCTTNSGVYGLKNFAKWNKKGTAVTKANEVYYDVFEKSDGSKVKHHNGKVRCLRQIGKMKYYRDGNKNNKIDETGTVYFANYSTNIHPNSYTHKAGIRSWAIGRWSTGCLVVNDLSKYFDVLMRKISFGYPVTYTLLKEF